MKTITWRLNDPTEGPYRPTKIHVVNPADDTRTLCGLRIPEWAYDSTYDIPIDDGSGSCQRCRGKVER